MCGPALNDMHFVEVCIVSSCSYVSGTLDNITKYERRVVATFNTLEENRNYVMTLTLEYNGGVRQESHPVNISKCSKYAWLHLVS